MNEKKTQTNEQEELKIVEIDGVIQLKPSTPMFEETVDNTEKE
jgi:hypothetical protein